MKNTNLVLLFLSLTMLVGCTTRVLVTSHQDRKADFASFKTFCYHGWEKNSDKMLTLSDKEFIENAFTAEFERRGMTSVTENGDIIVGLYVHTDHRKETTATTEGNPGNVNSYGNTYGNGNGGAYYYGYGYGGHYGYGPGYGWGNGGTYTNYETVNITQGTLICDVYDAEGKKLIWESIGKEVIDDDPGARQHTFALAVEAIMGKYPVGASKK